MDPAVHAAVTYIKIVYEMINRRTAFLATLLDR